MIYSEIENHLVWRGYCVGLFRMLFCICKFYNSQPFINGYIAYSFDLLCHILQNSPSISHIWSRHQFIPVSTKQYQPLIIRLSMNTSHIFHCFNCSTRVFAYLSTNFLKLSNDNVSSNVVGAFLSSLALSIMVMFSIVPFGLQSFTLNL